MQRSKHQVFLVIIAPAIIYPTPAFSGISEAFRHPGQIDEAWAPLAGQRNAVIQNSSRLNRTVLTYGKAPVATRTVRLRYHRQAKLRSNFATVE